MADTNEVQLLVKRIARDFSNPPKPGDFVFTAPAPVRVIDCVLSLNRNYDRFVQPRVTMFANRFPEIQSCSDLRALIDRYESPSEFVKDTLCLPSGDSRKANAISGVTDYLIEQQEKYDGKTEIDRLEKWARGAKPDGYRTVGVRFFAIGGFQYLRMLFGAETTKPDVHILAFVRETIGRRANEVQSLILLEEAAKIAGVSLRSLDFMIWESKARHGQERCAPPSSL